MTKILPIVKNPNALLRRQAAAVKLGGAEPRTVRPGRTGVGVKIATLQDASTQTLIDNMIATMWEADGVGIAAPQIGESVRIIIVVSGAEALPLINPIITKRSFRQEIIEEGCLSVPGLFGPVKRSSKVRCQAYDRGGKSLTLNADGLMARIIQHEVDHLNGILFIDRAKWVATVATAAKL